MQTLSRTQHLHNSFLLYFFDRKKRASLQSLCFEGKNRAKKISKRRIFSLFSSTTRKDKKKQGRAPKKEKNKILPTPFARTKIFFDDDDARKQKRSPPLLTNNANVAWTSNSRRNNQTYFIVTARAEERACGRDVGQTERVFRTREKEQISPFEIFSLSPSVFGHERASFAPKIPVRKALSFKR